MCWRMIGYHKRMDDRLETEGAVELLMIWADTVAPWKQEKQNQNNRKEELILKMGGR